MLDSSSCGGGWQLAPRRFPPTIPRNVTGTDWFIVTLLPTRAQSLISPSFFNIEWSRPTACLNLAFSENPLALYPLAHPNLMGVSGERGHTLTGVVFGTYL